MERNYPSDLTDGQWRKIRGLLRQGAKRGRKPLERRWVLNAILSVVRTGCPWRALPKDFPKWQTVDTVFRRGRKQGVGKRVPEALRERGRKHVGKKPTPTAAIIESQSVKTTAVGGPDRGSDAGKQVKGRKRHLAVDTLGRILAVVGQGAAVPDQEGAKRVFQHVGAEFGRLKVVFGDSASGRSGLPQWVLEPGKLIRQTVLRPVGVKGFVVLPKRWIVERPFGWLDRCRRRSKDYERNPASSEAMVHLAMIPLMARRLAAGEK